MISRDAHRCYAREYFHALRNNKSESEAAEQAMERTRKFVLDNTTDLAEMDRHQLWGTILERIIDWEIMLRVYPVDKSKIPTKDVAAAKELEAIKKQE